MKLAEALIERKDIQKKLECLRERMTNNSKVQEGTEPAEAPEALREELDTLIDRLEYLVVHINKTNELTIVEGGETISALIAKKDMLKKKISILGDMLESGSELIDRYTHTEIRVRPSFSVTKLQKQVDGFSKELRELDTKLQATNWVTDMI